ncbi:hypothetical protein LJC57_00270 [Parabacteroides sp. OttesenSCG-928-G07]|nr:hypothetical protein [Parabacteroides sp. OttesenSCG-928-G21]MDL2277007.1 hypothetical protein [Parabacteroides sp. OttesenSCG-928-G07]
MAKQKKGKFEALNPKNELFDILAIDKNPPKWWQFVKENITPEGFYVDIRKNNSLNVYYNGGSLLKITLSQGKIKGKIHEYYLHGAGSKYVDYELNRLPEDAEEIKKRIATKYSNSSESGIKARLICDPKAKYIDSEFAYTKVIGMKKNKKGEDVTDYLTTRIDLTKLENGKIVFVELKRIEDGRLLTNEYENGKPEILSQMNAYHEFVNEHKQEIIDYYKTLFTIKRMLGVLPESLTEIENIDGYVLSDNVELYIEPYASLTPKRKKRIEAIKTILNKNNIVHNLCK